MTREDTVELENFLRSDAIGYVWCQNLLTRYQQLKYNNLTDKQEGLKKEAIAICIANGYYIDESIHPDEIDKKKNLIHQLKEFDEIDLYADMLEQVVEVGREGTLTQDMVNRFLDIAEENPDVFICQYLAYVMGTSYLEDNASHYERTVEVIKVYDKLFEKEDVTEEQRKAEKLDVASGCMKCKDYETALSYLEEAADLGVGENVDMLIMQCYAKLDETEKCYKYAKNILEEYPDNLSALYYASTESLKQENIDESLEYAITLAEQVAETENNYDAEILLFQYAQFMVISDDSYWTDYQYAQYKNLTEEQWDKINESPLLGDYLNGLYYTFGDKDYETAASYADAILEVNDAYPQANYMRAVIAYQQEEFADAVTYYKKSLSIEDDSANAWFGLANAYDALEEYDLAYQCCQKVAALKPYMDHDSSWYGVSYHNNSLMNSLKEYVEDER
jgi:tetratricopeptide (TPR) repeat protein